MERAGRMEARTCCVSNARLHAGRQAVSEPPQTGDTLGNQHRRRANKQGCMYTIGRASSEGEHPPAASATPASMQAARQSSTE